MSNLSRLTDTAQAKESIGVIHNSGGHLVLCRPDKTPVWAGWQRQRPTLDISIQHDGLLGLVPYSLGATALDVDQGPWKQLPHSWVNYGTRRKGGRHLYYADADPRGNSQWSGAGCSGEVRGAKGYLILWRDAVDRLASAIAGPRQLSLFPFPAHLLQERGEPGELIQFPERTLNPARSLQLETVLEGARNDSLFDVVRLTAYGELAEYRKEGGNLSGWLGRVCSFADDNNRRFPAPLITSDVRSVAYSVGTWVWSRYFDHSSGKQKERGMKSGEARRAKNRERDLSIIQAASSGESASSIGRRLDVHHTTILRIITRELARASA